MGRLKRLRLTSRPERRRASTGAAGGALIGGASGAGIGAAIGLAMIPVSPISVPIGMAVGGLVGSACGAPSGAVAAVYGKKRMEELAGIEAYSYSNDNEIFHQPGPPDRAKNSMATTERRRRNSWSTLEESSGEDEEAEEEESAATNGWSNPMSLSVSATTAYEGDCRSSCAKKKTLRAKERLVQERQGGGGEAYSYSYEEENPAERIMLEKTAALSLSSDGCSSYSMKTMNNRRSSYQCSAYDDGSGGDSYGGAEDDDDGYQHGHHSHDQHHHHHHHSSHHHYHQQEENYEEEDEEDIAAERIRRGNLVPVLPPTPNADVSLRHVMAPGPQELMIEQRTTTSSTSRCEQERNDAEYARWLQQQFDREVEQEEDKGTRTFSTVRSSRSSCRGGSYRGGSGGRRTTPTCTTTRIVSEKVVARDRQSARTASSSLDTLRKEPFYG